MSANVLNTNIKVHVIKTAAHSLAELDTLWAGFRCKPGALELVYNVTSLKT